MAHTPGGKSSCLNKDNSEIEVDRKLIEEYLNKVLHSPALSDDEPDEEVKEE